MDALVVWLYSVFAAMPTLLFVLAFALLANKGFLPESVLNVLEKTAALLHTDPATLSVYAAIGLTGWSSMCIVIRAEVMKIAKRPFIAAARVTGVSNIKIIFRHLLPNISYLVIIFFTLRFAYAVMMFSVFIMLIPFIGWIIAILLGLIALPCMLSGSVWYIVRAIITACGKATDNDGLPITEWGA